MIGISLSPGMSRVSTPRQARVGAAELHVVEEGGDAVRAEGERDADHDLVQPQAHAKERHQHRHHEAGGGAREEAEPERVRAEGGGEAGVGAEQHHPFDADVEHAGLLRHLLAEPGQQQRHAGRDRARDQRD